MRVSGIDIGTNSLRVLIADINNLNRVVASLRLGFAVRLGEGVSSTGRVSEAALERTSRILGKSVLLARRLNASRILAGATHALRVAANSDEVVKELEDAAGIPVKVLTPEEEAYYVYTGVLSERFLTAISVASAAGCAPGSPGESSESPAKDGTTPGSPGESSESRVKEGTTPGSPGESSESRAKEGTAPGHTKGLRSLSASSGFVIDIGGGSTSLIKGSSTGRVDSCTLTLGCVTLTERFLRHDPPVPEELQALGDHIVDELSRADSLLLPEAEDAVTGVGGAVTSIAAISLGLPYYESRHVEGYILAREEMERCAQQLSRLPIEEIEKIATLGRRRAEIAVAGALILLLLACHLNLKRLTVSTRGLRYGLALEAAAHPAG